MFNHHLLNGIVCLQSVKPSLNCRNLCRQKAKGFLYCAFFFFRLPIFWNSFTLETLRLIWVAMSDVCTFSKVL